MELVVHKFAFRHVQQIAAQREKVWPKMVDYSRWNPGFAHAVVTSLEGEPGALGEVVHIQFQDAAGVIEDEIFSETVGWVKNEHITWLVTPAHEPGTYREFLDFSLAPGADGGVTFIQTYVGLTDTPDTELAEFLASRRDLLPELGVALTQYVEG